jgi:hypothetical protein
MTDLMCCGEQLQWLVAEEHSTRNLSPLSWRLWRCVRCETFHWQLNHSYPRGLPCVGAFFTHLDELRRETAVTAYDA